MGDGPPAPLADDENDPGRRAGDARPLYPGEPLLEIEPGADGDHHRRHGLEQHRVRRRGEGEGQIGRARRDEDARESQEGQGAEVTEAEGVELAPSAPGEQGAEKYRRDATAKRHEDERGKGDQRELGEGGIGAPEGGDQREGGVGAGLTRTGHPPIIARPSWPTMSSSGVCGCRVREPTSSPSSLRRGPSPSCSRAGCGRSGSWSRRRGSRRAPPLVFAGGWGGRPPPRAALFPRLAPPFPLVAAPPWGPF